MRNPRTSVVTLAFLVPASIMALTSLMFLTAPFPSTVASFTDGQPDSDNLFVSKADFAGAQTGLRTGVISGVTNAGWTTVTPGPAYASMVIVATPAYDAASPPLVTRIQNVGARTFQIRVQRVDGLTTAITGIDVHYMALEEGVYTQAEHGITMEAVKYTSTVTDDNNSWVAEVQTYSNTYTNPVVVGQVMSYNDSAWSTFWSRGGSRTEPPSSTDLRVGKHVGEDPVTTRLYETVGYVVIEQSNGRIGDISYTSAVGADSIQGVLRTEHSRPAPKFRVGQTLKIGLDSAQWPSPNIEGQSGMSTESSTGVPIPFLRKTSMRRDSGSTNRA